MSFRMNIMAPDRQFIVSQTSLTAARIFKSITTKVVVSLRLFELR